MKILRAIKRVLFLLPISFSIAAKPFGFNDQLNIAKEYAYKNNQKLTKVFIIVDSAEQTLKLYKQNYLQKTYKISTSKLGLGQNSGSRKTPMGLHKVCDKIGDGIPHYGIFKHRIYTGEVWPKSTPRQLHRKDYIVTRILWLEGLEPGINKGYSSKDGKMVDSKNRTIYIHGTTMEWKLGTPATIGCVHMSSRDVVSLFNQVPIGSLVLIL